MRPRHEASDDQPLPRQHDGRAGASMRPRHEASDDIEARTLELTFSSASMRPRHEASDDLPSSGGNSSCTGFNEAEARSLG